MKMTVPHPSDTDVYAEVGLDPFVGHFATVYEQDRVAESVDGLSDARGLPAVLDMLVARAFFAVEDVLLARRELAHRHAADVEDPDVRRAAGILEALRMAAAE